MIRHSFHYRSEHITGLGYGLAFLAIAISPMSDLSLIAAALLGASLVAVLRVMPWYYLGTAGVIATYACFAMWHELLVADDPMFSESNFALGMGMPVFNWVACSIVQFLRRPADARERDLLLTLVTMNCAGFLGLGAYIVSRGNAESSESSSRGDPARTAPVPPRSPARSPAPPPTRWASTSTPIPPESGGLPRCARFTAGTRRPGAANASTSARPT
jgi:hypothetical protein